MRTEGYGRIENTVSFIVDFDKRVLRGFITTTAKMAAQALTKKPYPPPTGGRYKRRGMAGGLKGSYVHTKIDTMSYAIENTAVDYRPHRPYGAYVVGNGQGDMQAKIHEGRWYIGLTVAEEVIDKRVEWLSERIGKEIAKS